MQPPIPMLGPGEGLAGCLEDVLALAGLAVLVQPAYELAAASTPGEPAPAGLPLRVVALAAQLGEVTPAVAQAQRAYARFADLGPLHLRSLEDHLAALTVHPVPASRIFDFTVTSLRSTALPRPTSLARGWREEPVPGETAPSASEARIQLSQVHFAATLLRRWDGLKVEDECHSLLVSALQGFRRTSRYLWIDSMDCTVDDKVVAIWPPKN